MARNIKFAKTVAILSFVVLLFVTYFLRSQVLTLNRIRFSAENVRSDENMRQLKESAPVRLAEYEAQMKQYEIQMKHYRQMLDLYNNDYDEYVKRRKDRYAPPKLPSKPQRPRSPEVSDELAKINAEFRQQQYRYFSRTSFPWWAHCSICSCSTWKGRGYSTS